MDKFLIQFVNGVNLTVTAPRENDAIYSAPFAWLNYSQSVLGGIYECPDYTVSRLHNVVTQRVLGELFSDPAPKTIDEIGKNEFTPCELYEDFTDEQLVTIAQNWIDLVGELTNA